ncbi:MAG TPA: NAD-dependent epimerase/dehydratase family protein [Vicinamibacterales bacterium]|nr:NAD-dependent epimerase/dehydratase family protein [Vicinamibacterales bacterium]
MRALIIGGTGFIGPHIARELVRAGHDVTVFHRGRTSPPAGARELIGDRRRLHESAGSLRALAADVVVDVVLSSGRQARELIEVFSGHASRVIAVSSMDVYRACGVTHGLEEGPLEPLPLREERSALRTKLQTYPASQVRMLQQVFGWLDEDYDKIPVEREVLGHASLPGTVVRLPMVYGAGDPLHRFHPIVKRILDGRRAILFSASMARWRATKGYVEDVGAAIAAAAVSDIARGRIYNVGEADTLTELEWAELVAGASGWDGEFKLISDDRLPAHLRAPGNTAQQWIADTSRIREELGVRETVGRADAVRRTVEWERACPPTGFTPHQFDYALEDDALKNAT